MASRGNYYYILCENEDEYSPESTKNSTDECEDDETVITSNCRTEEEDSTENNIEIKKVEVTNNITRVTNKPKLNQAIGDTGTTGNFVLPGVPVDDIKIAENPIEIEMPNGVIEKSTHTCYLHKNSTFTKRIKGSAHCARLIPLLPNINQKIMQRRMCRYFQRQNM